METFNDRFENLLKKRGLTKVRIAELLGVMNSTVCAWRTSVPNTETVFKLARYFNVDPEWLVLGTFKKNQNLNSRINGLTADQIEAIDSIVATFERQNLTHTLNR